MINAIFFVVLALIVWFQTNAFHEYCKALGLDGFFYLDEYSKLLKEGGDLDYPDFLAEYYPSFFTKLISCPICLTVWLSGILSLFINICSVGTIAVSSLLLYKLISMLLKYER